MESLIVELINNLFVITITAFAIIGLYLLINYILDRLKFKSLFKNGVYVNCAGELLLIEKSNLFVTDELRVNLNELEDHEYEFVSERMQSCEYIGEL